MKVSIVEDDDLLRENLKILLGGEPNIEVCNTFSSAEEAMAGLFDNPPEILLVDLGLPKMSGIDLIAKVKEKEPSIDIMVHSAFSKRETVFSAIKAGASGYILKGSTPREIVEGLFEMKEGGAPMTPKIARAVIGEFQQQDTQDQYLLSQRETVILQGLEEGLTYKEIATRHHISPHTVHSHIKKIYEKLHAKGRQEALTVARQKGLI